MARRLEKLTYQMKKKVTALGKNADEYFIKEKRSDCVVVVNIRTGKEIILK